MKTRDTAHCQQSMKKECEFNMRPSGGAGGLSRRSKGLERAGRDNRHGIFNVVKGWAHKRASIYSLNSYWQQSRSYLGFLISLPGCGADGEGWMRQESGVRLFITAFLLNQIFIYSYNHNRWHNWQLLGNVLHASQALFTHHFTEFSQTPEESVPLFEFPLKEKRRHLFEKLGQEHKEGKGFSRGSVSKEFVCNAGDAGLIPGSGRSPGEAYGNPHKYSCLESLTDKGAWWATAHAVTGTRARLKRRITHTHLVKENLIKDIITSWLPPWGSRTQHSSGPFERHMGHTQWCPPGGLRQLFIHQLPTSLLGGHRTWGRRLQNSQGCRENLPAERCWCLKWEATSTYGTVHWSEEHFQGVAMETQERQPLPTCRKKPASSPFHRWGSASSKRIKEAFQGHQRVGAKTQGCVTLSHIHTRTGGNIRALLPENGTETEAVWQTGKNMCF